MTHKHQTPDLTIARLKIVKDKFHQRTPSNRSVASAPSPAARATAHGPIRATISDSVDQHFAGIIINHERNDGFAACRDGTQAMGDSIAEASLVRRGLQCADGRFDLGQLAGGCVGPGIVEDPVGDSIKVTGDERMDPDAG